MDGVALLDKSPPPRPVNGADRQATAFFDRQLIEAMAACPAASASVLAGVLGVGRGSVISRWRRLSARGSLVKDRGGRWRVRARSPDPAEAGDAERSEFETPDRPTPVFAFDYDPNIWLNHVNYFYDLVRNSDRFACRRYG